MSRRKVLEVVGGISKAVARRFSSSETPSKPSNPNPSIIHTAEIPFSTFSPTSSAVENPTENIHPQITMDLPPTSITHEEYSPIDKTRVAVDQFKIVAKDETIYTDNLHYCSAVFLIGKKNVGLLHTRGFYSGSLAEGDGAVNMEIANEFLDEFLRQDQVLEAVICSPLIIRTNPEAGGPTDLELRAEQSSNIVKEIIKNRVSVTEEKTYPGLSGGKGGEFSWDGESVKQSGKSGCIIL